MAFFEQIGKHLTDAGQSVSQQTKNFAELSRLNSAISEKEKKISELYVSIGQSYYEMHKNDISAREQVLINEINILYSEIVQCKEKINKIKGMIKCPNCGVDIPAHVVFCSACGAKVECGEKINDNQPQNVERTDRPNLLCSINFRNRKVGIFAVVVVIVLVLIIAATLVAGGRDYETTTNQFIDALFGADVETMIELFPGDMTDIMEEDYGSQVELLEELEEYLQNGINNIERYFGENWKLSYEILNVKNLSSKELEKTKEYYNEIANIKVSDAKIVEVECTIRGNDMDESETISACLVKVGGSWYIDVINTDFSDF